MRAVQHQHILCFAQALQTVMQRQEVDYDFEVYTLPQPACAAVTILSAGASLFKDAVDVLLPLAPSSRLGAPPPPSPPLHPHTYTYPRLHLLS